MLYRETPHGNLELTWEQKLEASEKRIRTLIRYGTDLISIIDHSFRYLFVPDPSRRVLGYSAGHFLGKNAMDYIHPDDRNAITEAVRNLPPNAHTVLPIYRFLASNGEWRWIETHITNLSEDPAINGMAVNSKDVTDKIKVEAERAAEIEKVQKLLNRAIVQSQEKERVAIGNELHDNVNQLLTTVKLYLVMAKENANSAETLLPKAIGFVQESIDEIRKLTTRLASPRHRDQDLNQAVKDLIESIAASGALKLHFSPAVLDEVEVSEEVQLTIYRVIQEQLTNILRHADAVTAEISLFVHEEIITLTMVDDGKGFFVKQRKKGLGIVNMQNRVEAVSGLFEIASQPGAGCRLSASFPVVKCPAS